jgi:hypothetical protein
MAGRDAWPTRALAAKRDDSGTRLPMHANADGLPPRWTKRSTTQSVRGDDQDEGLVDDPAHGMEPASSTGEDPAPRKLFSIQKLNAIVQVVDEEITPQAALAAAASARSAASARVVPGWFPSASASAFAAGLTLLGASILTSGSIRWALGLAGAVALAGFAALWAALAAWWQRHGVVPAAPRLDRRLSSRQRHSALAAEAAAIALSLATLAITGRAGWAAIAMGWLLGAASWYRLRLRAA